LIVSFFLFFKKKLWGEKITIRLSIQPESILKIFALVVITLLFCQAGSFCLAANSSDHIFSTLKGKILISSIIHDKNDNTFLIVGTTTPNLAACSDVFISKIKVNASMNIIWTKTFGGSLNDGANEIIQTADGGYAVIGYSDLLSKGDDAWVIKLNSDGNVQWNKAFGGTGLDSIDTIIQTKDGGYALCGFTESLGQSIHNAWFIKLDSSGNTTWTQTYSVSNYNEIVSVIETTDGGYALAGRTQCSKLGGLSFWMVKVDSSGNLQWDKQFGQRENDFAKLIVQTSDGGYVLLGTRFSYTLGNCSWLIKVNAFGVEQWNQTIKGSKENGKLTDVINTSDGAYILVGYSDKSEAWLTKVDQKGVVQWSHEYGKIGQNYLSVIQLFDGQYVLCGSKIASDSNTDFWLVLTQKIDKFISPNSSTDEYFSPTINTESHGSNIVLYLLIAISLCCSIIGLFFGRLRKNRISQSKIV
jgi:hypothetical protein